MPPGPTFRTDVEPPAPHQRIAGEKREVEQQLDRALGQLLVLDHPAELDLAVAEQALERRLCLSRVDLVGEAAAGAERQAEEFELVGGRPSAVREQLEALLAHVGVGLVGEQLDRRC